MQGVRDAMGNMSRYLDITEGYRDIKEWVHGVGRGWDKVA
jgi:hypothetical protein